MAERTYTLYVCPVCGEEERMDYTIESMVFPCDHVSHDSGITILVAPVDPEDIGDPPCGHNNPAGTCVICDGASSPTNESRGSDA